MRSPGDLKYYQWNLHKLCAIRLFFWMFFFSSVMTIFFTQWGGLDLFQVLLLNSWFFLWNFVLEVPTGALADRLGRKWSLVLGSLAGTVATLVYILKPDFRVFLVAEVIFAFAFTLHSGADDALAYDSLLALGKARDSKAFLGRMENFKLTGIILATLTGGFIAERWGLRAPMAAYVAPSTIGLFIGLSLKEPPRPSRREKKGKLSYGKILREGVRFFLKHKVLGALAMELAVTNAFMWALIWLFQPLLQRDGAPIRYFGVVHALSCAGQILILTHIAEVERIAGSKKGFLLWATVLAGAMFLMLGLVHWLPVTILAIILAFSFGLSRMPVFTSYMNKYIPSDKRATVLSAASMMRTFSLVIMKLISGALAKWSLSGAMTVLGAALVALTAFSRVEESHLKD
jgi:predicted MFS family arabinose efflux permease